MKHIRMETFLPATDIIARWKDDSRVNEGVRFDEKQGKPHLMIKEGTGGRVRARCVMLGGPSRDNGYLQGTAFYGSVRERDGKTVVRGWILTEPVFHVLWFCLIAFFVYTCFARGGFSVIPVCLVIFVYAVFLKEYRKQDVLRRYMFRAVRQLERERK